MDELELVGLADDGEHLVLTRADGQRFRVRIDEPLRAAVRRDRPQLEQLLTNLRDLSNMLGQHDDLLRSTLQSGPVALRGLANATGNGNAGEMPVGNGLLIDSWMCAISGRAKQFNMIQYYKDCQ